MVETPSNHATINMYPQLYHGMQLRLNEISRIIDQFIAEILEKESISKTLSTYIAVLYYVDKILLALSVVAIINTEKKYDGLKESIRTVKSQIIDVGVN